MASPVNNRLATSCSAQRRTPARNARARSHSRWRPLTFDCVWFIDVKTNPQHRADIAKRRQEPAEDDDYYPSHRASSGHYGVRCGERSPPAALFTAGPLRLRAFDGSWALVGLGSGKGSDKRAPCTQMLSAIQGQSKNRLASIAPRSSVPGEARIPRGPRIRLSPLGIRPRNASGPNQLEFGPPIGP